MNKSTLTTIILFGVILFGCNTKSNREPKKSISKEKIQDSSNKVICNIFKLNAERHSKYLSIHLKTDLPNNTQIKLRAYRPYHKRDEVIERSMNYFSKKMTIVELNKTPNDSFLLDNDKWTKKLIKQQNELAKEGRAGQIKSVSSVVKLQAIVLPNQFGNNNVNLTGKAVNKTNIKTVDDKDKVYYPIDFFSEYAPNSLNWNGNVAGGFVEKADYHVRRAFSANYQGRDIGTYGPYYLYYKIPKGYTINQFKRDAISLANQYGNVSIIKTERMTTAFLIIFEITVGNDTRKVNISCIPMENSLTVGIDRN